MKFTKAARPVIMGQNGMVSSGHQLASLGGRENSPRGRQRGRCRARRGVCLWRWSSLKPAGRAAIFSPWSHEKDRQSRSAQLQRAGAGQSDHRIFSRPRAKMRCRNLVRSASLCRARWTAGWSCTKNTAPKIWRRSDGRRGSHRARRFSHLAGFRRKHRRDQRRTSLGSIAFIASRSARRSLGRSLCKKVWATCLKRSRTKGATVFMPAKSPTKSARRSSPKAAFSRRRRFAAASFASGSSR